MDALIFQMQDAPLPPIEQMQKFEKAYLTLALENMREDAERELTEQIANHEARKLNKAKMAFHEFYKDCPFNKFQRSVRFLEAITYRKKMQARFIALSGPNWDWDTYFKDLEIDNYYVRWYFV